MQVPVQALYAHGEKYYCFVYNDGSWAAREIKPGPTNDKHIVVQNGLNEGDKVAMNPRGYLAEVSLPKLAPEEAQRAVPQPPAARREQTASRESGESANGKPASAGGDQQVAPTTQPAADAHPSTAAKLPSPTGASQGAGQ
jgi:hypothetical protein